MQRIRPVHTLGRAQIRHCKFLSMLFISQRSFWLSLILFLYAREDCFHLSHSLPSLIPDAESYRHALTVLGPNLSDTIFKPYAERRQPRTSYLVKGARAVGEQRTAIGAEACRLRDEMVLKRFLDEALLASRMDELLREPFQDL
jgi:hypothetical protein